MCEHPTRYANILEIVAELIVGIAAILSNGCMMLDLPELFPPARMVSRRFRSPAVWRST
jgi:hypothetical protein